jgi:uncharacterized protein YqhQ
VSEGWAHVVEGWRALAGQTLRLIALVVITPVGVVSIVWSCVIMLPSIVGDTVFGVSHAALNMGLILLMVPLAYLWVLTMSHIYKAVMIVTPEAGFPR